MGDQYGCVHLWSSTKKNAIFSIQLSKPFPQIGTGSIREACAGWVYSMATCKNTDLFCFGLGDGAIRVLKYNQASTLTENDSLTSLGFIPIRGFVNGLKLARSARFLLD